MLVCNHPANLVAMILAQEYGGWKVWREERRKSKRKKGGERKEGSKTRKIAYKVQRTQSSASLFIAFLNTFPFFLCVYSGNLAEYWRGWEDIGIYFISSPPTHVPSWLWETGRKGTSPDWSITRSQGWVGASFVPSPPPPPLGRVVWLSTESSRLMYLIKKYLLWTIFKSTGA